MPKKTQSSKASKQSLSQKAKSTKSQSKNQKPLKAKFQSSKKSLQNPIMQSKQPKTSQGQSKTTLNTPALPKNAQKAYKLLALQENLSNAQAKDLIDRGLVTLKGQKVKIARTLINPKSQFKIIPFSKPQIIFEDKNVLALDKPPFITSEEALKLYPSWALLHRLDRETSGVLLLVKPQSAFHSKAKEAFKTGEVFKQYLAIVEGILEEEQEITTPLLIQKGNYAKVKLAPKNSSLKNPLIKETYTKVTPLEIYGKKTKVSILIKTGRTHQIRIHLSSIKHPIVGDTLYGAKEAKRIFLHAHKISLLGYEFCSIPSKDFDFS